MAEAHRRHHCERRAGRARKHRGRDGLQADAHVLFIDYPRIGGFRRGTGRCRGAGPRRIGAVDAAAIGADPGLCPRHPEDARGARRYGAAGRRDHAQRRLCRRQPRPGCRHSWCRCSTTESSSRSPRRPRTISISARLARVAAASSMRSTLLPRGCNSRRSRSMTAVSATSRSGSCCATTFASPTSSSGTCKRRSRRRGSAPSGFEALIERHGYPRFKAACEAVMDYAERLMRQAIAAAAGRRLSRRDDDRRLCRQSRPGKAPSADCCDVCACAVRRLRSI